MNYQGKIEQSQTETRTTISALPPELLLFIFEFCYEDFQRDEESQPELADPPWHYVSASLDPSSMRPTSTSELFDRFRSPTRFPFALAAVSPLWNDLLLTQPEYWTEVIYVIDSCTSTSDMIKTVQKHQVYPRDMPLDFIVTVGQEGSGQLSHSLNDLQERDQLHTLIATYLNNHFPYFRTVAIEACSGESFPDIMGGWRYRATNANYVLLSSILLARQSNYTYPGRTHPRFKSFDQRYYSLNTLSVHGLNLEGFYPSILNGQISNLEQLVISDYTFSAASLSLTELLQTLAMLPHLARLKLQNILLDQESDPTGIPTFTCNILHLHLESIPRLIMTKLDQICDFVNLETLHLTKCVYYDFQVAADLQILEDIEIDDFKSEMGHWLGSTLWFGRYRGSCDDFFDMLGEYNETTLCFQCPRMNTLYLYQIPQLSLQKLKEVVRSRNKEVDYRDPSWRTGTTFGPAIRKLSIDQCGIAALTDDDVNWFSSMLVEFAYIP